MNPPSTQPQPSPMNWPPKAFDSRSSPSPFILWIQQPHERQGPKMMRLPPNETAARESMVARLQKRLETTSGGVHQGDGSSDQIDCVFANHTTQHRHHQPHHQRCAAPRTLKAARSLEQLLFRSACRLDEYCDLSTLDDRIRTIVTVQLYKRLRRRTAAAAASSSSINARHGTTPHRRRQDALLDAIGSQQRYRRAGWLVRHIGESKTAKAATMGGCSGGGGTTCGTLRNEFNSGGDRRFPRPVRDLFFDTPLVLAFNKAPVEGLHEIDWDVLIRDAEAKLGAFRKYNETVGNAPCGHVTKQATVLPSQE